MTITRFDEDLSLASPNLETVLADIESISNKHEALLKLLEEVKSYLPAESVPENLRAAVDEALKVLAQLANTLNDSEKPPAGKEGYGYPPPAGSMENAQAPMPPADDEEYEVDPATGQKTKKKKKKEAPMPVAMTAHGAPAPIAPFPREWFEDPGLTELSPLTVTADGRVFGLFALRDTCHIGLPGCVPPPQDDDFRFFHRQPVPTTAGPVLTGPLCLTSGHLRDLRASLQAAQEHYDNPKFVTARGCAGYTADGHLYFAGAVLPHVPHEDAQLLSMSDVSGDWRPTGSKRQLVGICAVAVPGFPITTPLAASALTASAADDPSLALIAAGSFPRNELWRIPVTDLQSRIDSLEKVINILRPLAASAVRSKLENK